MKISSAIAFLSLGAVSAFGLKPSSPITNAATVASKAAFGGKAMVQPIGIDGQRLGNNDFVSSIVNNGSNEEGFSFKLFLKRVKGLEKLCS